MSEVALPPAVAELIARFPEAPIIETVYEVSVEDFAAQVAKQAARQSDGASIGVVWLENNTTPLVGRTKIHPGWALPGGTVEPGESYTHAFEREVFEEVGIRIAMHSLRLMALERRAFASPSGQRTYLNMAVFEAEALAGEQATQTEEATREGLTIQAFPANALPKTILFGGKESIMQSVAHRQNA